MLVLTMNSPETLAQTPNTIVKCDNYLCLPREEREKIAVCFRENYQCHKDLFEIAQPEPKTDWKDFAIWFAIGAAAGAVLGRQIALPLYKVNQF